MLKIAEDSLRTVPHEIDDPERIPVKRYYDPDFYRAELEHLWPHVWQMACRVEQITEVGDWVEYESAGTSVVIVRTHNGVKAFHNSCRHRGVPIVGGGKGHAHGNCAHSGLVCPFHGWRWNMNGEHAAIYGRHLFSERQMAGEDLNLVECRSEVWGGSVWINHDNGAPSVKESLGPLADRLEAHNIEHLRAEWWYGTVLPANWKVAMEAFMEGYHVATTHPQLHHALDGLYYDMYSPHHGVGGATEENLRAGAMPGTSTRAAIAGQLEHLELLSDGMAGMIHAKEVEIARQFRDTVPPGEPNEAIPIWYGMIMKAITEQLRARGEPVPDLLQVSQSAPIRAVEFMFPHYFVLPLFTSMSAYRIRPLGPESCFFEMWSLTFFAEGEESETVLEPTILPYDSPEFPPIPRQDYSNIPIQQRGLHASGFEFMRLSRDVEGMISNYQRLIDGYLAGVPQTRLARAQHYLGGNFDSQIHDIWA